MDTEINKQKEQLSFPFLSASDGQWNWEISTNEVYFSPEWKVILGYQTEETKNWEKLVHPDDYNYFSSSITEFINNTTNELTLKFRILHKNGYYILTLNRILKAKNNTPGNSIQLIGKQFILSNLKKTAKLVQKLSSALEQYPIAITITDLNGKIEYSNPRFTDLTGYPNKEVIGMKSSEFSSGKTDPSVYKKLWETILQGQIWRGEFINKKKNGEEIIQRALISPLLNKEGIITNFIASYDDITEQKRIEKKIFEQQLALQESYRELEKEKKITEESITEIKKLNEFTRIINSTLNTPKVLKEIYSYICESTGFDIVWIILVHPRKNHIFSEANLSIFDSSEELDLDFFSNFRKKLNQSLGILFHTYTTKKPFYLKDIQRAKRKVLNSYDNELIKLTKIDFEIQKKGNFKSILQLPLILQDEVIGILNLTGRNQTVKMQIKEIEKMMRFADQIAGVIHNTRLMEEMQDAQKEAELSEKIAQMAHKEIEQEKAQSDRLLLNILPTEIAKELKEKGSSAPVFYKSVSVMFTDFKGFTQISETMTPNELIEELDICFSYFDSLMDRYNLEKLKTIGDSYMCAGGIPVVNNTHPVDAVLAALEIQAVMNESKKLRQSLGLEFWELRLGIHTGPLIAGVIGEKKFSYDVWGDTVNTASRMEASGTPEMVNISSSTYELVKDFFECQYRGKIQAKNKGFVEMYYVNGIKKNLTLDEESRMPSFRFWILYDRLRKGEPLNPENLDDRRKGFEDSRSDIKERRKRNLVVSPINRT